MHVSELRTKVRSSFFFSFSWISQFRESDGLHRTVRIPTFKRTFLREANEKEESKNIRHRCDVTFFPIIDRLTSEHRPLNLLQAIEESGIKKSYCRSIFKIVSRFSLTTIKQPNDRAKKRIR